MQYQVFLPSSDLSDFIQFFWVLEGGSRYCHHGMADVGVEIVFHFKGVFNELLDGKNCGPTALMEVCGQTNKTSQFETPASFGIFGVYLFPYTLPIIFRISGKEFTRKRYAIDLIFGEEGKSLGTKILFAKNHQARIALFESYLRAQLIKIGPVDLKYPKLVKSLMHRKEMPTVTQVAGLGHISIRQLERKFNDLVGLSPKQFLRINRFQKTFTHYHSKDLNLTQIALQHGYYDQSHFTHDFKQFSGIHPKTFFRGNTEATIWRN